MHAGEIVGIDDYDLAVYWREGIEPIYLGDYGTRAYAINQAGQIAGSAILGAERRAVRWDHLSLVDLGVMPGGGFAEAGWSARASTRRGRAPRMHHDDVGFRVARGGFDSTDAAQGWSARADAERAAYDGPTPPGWTPLR